MTQGKTYTEISGTSAASGTDLNLDMNFDFGGSKFSKITLHSKGYGFFFSSTSSAVFPWYGAAGQVSYLKSDTKFTIQFKNVKDDTGSSYASYNYQVILDSKDNSIEFLYGPKSKTSSSYKPYATFVGMNTSKTSNDIIYGGTSNSTLNHGDFPASGTSIKYTPGTQSTAVTDPLYMFQWHLYNYGQLGGTLGEDVNFKTVYSSGNKGDGIKVVVVDDGQDILHEDLKDNVLSGA
nr:hypothetical protein [Leptospiraceae bacterium]